MCIESVCINLKGKNISPEHTYVYICGGILCMMDKRTTYFRLVRMLRELDIKIITLDQLEGLIMMNIGGNKRTIQSCLTILNKTGLIRDIGDYRFEIVDDSR